MGNDLKGKSLFTTLKGISLEKRVSTGVWQCNFGYSKGYPRFTIFPPTPYGAEYKSKPHIFAMRQEFALAVATMVEDVNEDREAYKVTLYNTVNNEVRAIGDISAEKKQGVVYICFKSEKMDESFPLTYDSKWMRLSINGKSLDSDKAAYLRAKDYVDMLRNAVSHYEVLYSNNLQTILEPKDKE